LVLTANEMPRFGRSWNLTLQGIAAAPIAFCIFGLSDQVLPIGALPLPLAAYSLNNPSSSRSRFASGPKWLKFRLPAALASRVAAFM